MAINLNVTSAGTRENRLGSITGYSGDLHDLVQQSRCGTLKEKERCFSQSSSCDAGCALNQLASITDVAVINHAPSGCTAGSSTVIVHHTQLAAKRGVEYDTVFIGTDMDESDTIFGATTDLREIIIETYNRYKPKAIFVGTSCVSGIIGEDVDSVIAELQSELPIPLAPVHCEGFKSRVWASGFDAADHAVLTSIVKPPQKKSNVINFKNFNESARKEIIEIFSNFGMEPFFFYANSTVEELSHLAEAQATVSICGTLGTYLGNGLEQEYGVPYIKTINPLGIVGFETWLREIGRVIEKEAAVEAYIEQERAFYLPKIEAVKKELTGLRAVLGMGASFAFQVSRVLQELGIEVVWVASWHFDAKYDNGETPPYLEQLVTENPNNFKVSVSDQQNFEILNILNTYKPDIYLARHPGTTVWAIKQGIAALFLGDEYKTFGYRGTLDFANTILDTIRNRSFEKNLASRITLPYSDWWYKQDNAAFLKEDVK
ncbi:nitrogenase component 1 [Sporomusa sp.]|uniref:nitrogenase component 1 n=1 Tax=Sporomusa sp. TaxID=2078658 RepID=UPI002CBF6333|nr:nitrogenase component 1 [Sporomusa sp.]HWR43921.1 nitrogenase component 1 [Sporomusa sp.]